MIRYDPSKMLQKVAPERKLKKLVSRGLTFKRAALSFVSDIEFLDPKAIRKVALKTIKNYRERVKEDPSIKDQLAKDPALLINRVQNTVVYEIAQGIKEKYNGEFYRWLPSDAEEPDPEHQLNYGKVFKIGEGEMPGERYGCRCGMEILTEDSSLEL